MVAIPSDLRENQGPLVYGEFHWIDVLLKNRKAYKGLTSNGEQILGTFDRAKGGTLVAEFPFKPEEIQRVRPHRFYPFRDSILWFFAPEKY